MKGKFLDWLLWLVSWEEEPEGLLRAACQASLDVERLSSWDYHSYLIVDVAKRSRL